MKKAEQDRLAAEFEADADNNDLWEEVPPPSPYRRRRLGTQVTIRLEPDDAERLRKLARHHDTNYTSMLRVWIEQRLWAEVAALARRPVEIDAQPAGHGGYLPIQVSGAGRLVELLTTPPAP
jgi:predicted transcriptional regulator